MPEQIQGLALLLFRKFVEDIAHFVIAAALHRLFVSERAFCDLRRLGRRINWYRSGHFVFSGLCLRQRPYGRAPLTPEFPSILTPSRK
jgi:hypothetical protein